MSEGSKGSTVKVVRSVTVIVIISVLITLGIGAFHKFIRPILPSARSFKMTAADRRKSRILSGLRRRRR